MNTAPLFIYKMRGLSYVFIDFIFRGNDASTSTYHINNPRIKGMVMKQHKASKLIGATTLVMSMVVALFPQLANAATLEETSEVYKTLSSLRVVSGSDPAGYTYSRDAFKWNAIDLDSNGCRTRDDILHRDLDNINVDAKDACIVKSGTLDDPYTGKTIAFTRGQSTSAAVQIDHIVALKDAWRTGAYAWPDSKKHAYANDPFVLAAVDGPANQQKSDQAASTWIPSNYIAQCPYVASQIAIKQKYDLGVTANEKQSMLNVLNSCNFNVQLPEDSPETSLVRLVQGDSGNKPLTEDEMYAQQYPGFAFGAYTAVANNGEKRVFRGTESVKRQDMAAFLYRWAGSPTFTLTAADKQMFIDVNESTPHAEAIWWLAKNGISEGWYTDRGRVFRGTESVKRQDMAAFMRRLASVHGPARTKSLQFADVHANTPHASDIRWLAETGVSEGWLEHGQRYFKGMVSVKRQDMAAFLQRLATYRGPNVNTNAWVRSMFQDVSNTTAHVDSIYWLALTGISVGWPYVAPEPEVYYKNCAAVRAAGKAPLYRGQPGYGPHLDRDGDGIACE
ncbi:deoxyribonuclease [Bifidobacterium dolichotidis]|uniref:Deoxyribonuclease n=1 Tax=Bifidobacterium dolichotidis TaxID=2306976 RepID=A0A430FKH9_9BIFI|nr:deoxyribonuclease [Bifidobacterium dolichotidis]